MGIINEITHIYNALSKLNRYELNGIISEHISEYSYKFLTEAELCDIKRNFGSVESFSNILAESFTRNNGSFDTLFINENTVDESTWGSLGRGVKNLFTKGSRGVARRMAGKPVGNVVKRFGKSELSDIAKYTGKQVSNLTHKDIGRYAARNLTQNANKNVVKQLEKQAAWLSKNTNMNSVQMEEFMRKYAKCPADCDPKIWKKAFEEEAKLFNNGTKLDNGLIRARYNAIAKESGAGGRNLARSAGKTTITRRMLSGLKKFGKRAVWKFIKWGGIIYLLYLGVRYFWDDIKGWIKAGGRSSGSSRSSLTNNLSGLYPKTYGVNYRGENPEDYRII